MRQIIRIAGQARVFIGLALVAAAALLLILTMSGQRVSTTFSSINSGLSDGGGYAGGAPQEGAISAGHPSPAQSGDAPGRVIIRSASLQIEVADVARADAEIRAMVDRAGGYVTSSSAYGDGDDLVITLILSVPTEQFDTTLSAAQSLAERVRSRSVSGQDVTEEFVDLQARLRNLEATRDRVEGFLGKAAKIEEALQINAALSDLQGQIEQIQGRIQFLSQSAAFSSIEVGLQPVPVVPLVGEEGWQPATVARGALRDVIAAGQGLLNLAIVLAIWSPLIAPPLLLAGWAWRRTRTAIGKA